MSEVSNTPSVLRAEIVRSPSGGTHIYQHREGEDIFTRRTLCGLTLMGWEHLRDLRGSELFVVSCSRCDRKWGS